MLEQERLKKEKVERDMCTYNGVVYSSKEEAQIAKEENAQIELLKKRLLSTKKQEERRKIITEFGSEPTTLESKKRYQELRMKSELPKPKSITANWIYGITILGAFVLMIILATVGMDESVVCMIMTLWVFLGIPIWSIWKIVLLIKSISENYYLNIKKI